MGGRSAQKLLAPAEHHYPILEEDYTVVANAEEDYAGSSTFGTGPNEYTFRTINAYTRDGADRINGHIRSGAMSEIDNQFAHNLDEALLNNSITEFSGHVYRISFHSGTDQELLDATGNIGGVISWPTYLSTSKFLINSPGSGGIAYNIISKTGKSIETLSKFPSEKEILFGRNTKFRILKVEGRTVFLEQI